MKGSLVGKGNFLLVRKEVKGLWINDLGFVHLHKEWFDVYRKEAKGGNKNSD